MPLRSTLAVPVLAVALLAVSEAGGQTAPPSSEIEGDGLARRMQLIGQVKVRSALEIAANDWSVGTEAIDRDYSTYAKWREYLGPLGVKHARLQSGWARTDLGGGRYDFSWLDPVVEGMLADGVQPWLSLSYGNERYTGGGVPRRDSALPAGTGRKAWLAYVTAVTRRYRGKIREYEIWNEPDLNVKISADEYGQFAFETARAIKAVDPAAGIILGAFAHAVWGGDGLEFAERSLRQFAALGGKADVVTYHAYSANPDEVYGSLERFRAMIRDLDPTIEVRQGENGAPSLNQPTYALRNLWWTEESQAKWLLRRMLGDAARGLPTSIFSLTEMHYPPAAETNLSWHRANRDLPPPTTAKHFKGLLETRRYAPGTPDDDRTVVRTKMGYRAMQAVTAIFDARTKPVPVRCSVTGASGPTSAFAFRRDDGLFAVAVWRDGDRPGARPLHEAADIHCRGVRFAGAPRYVDLLTRAVYATNGVAQPDGDSVRITALPIYDSPVLVLDAGLVSAQ